MRTWLGGRTLRWAVWLLAVEAAGMVAVTAILLVADVTGTAMSVGGAVTVTVFAAFLAGAFALLAVNLGRRRRWARGPAVVLQLLMLPIGYSMLTGGAPWLGLPVLALGLFGAAVLIAPATREELGIQ